MMRFRLMADAQFDAENLAHAARLLEDHFRDLWIEVLCEMDANERKAYASNIEFCGRMDLRPIPAVVPDVR